MANLGQLQQIDDYIKSPLPQLGEMKATPTVQSKPKLAEYPAYNELQQARASEQSNGLGDYVRTFGAAVPKVGAGVVELANKVGLVSDETRNEIQKGADRSSQALYSKMAPSFVKSATQPLFKDDPEDKLKWYQQFNPDYDTTTLLHDLTASTPGIIAMGAGGAGMGKASTKILSPILERLGIGETVASHFPSLAKMAETAFPGEATAAAKVNKLIAHQVGMRGGQVASEGLLTASQGASDKRQEALNTPLETYRKNPLFQGIVNGQDPGVPLDQREEKARAELAERAADHVFTSTFQSTAGIAALTGGGALGDIAARTGKVTTALHKAMLKEGVKEGIAQELPQSYNEQLISNIATKKFIDPDKDVLEGTVDAALKGGITGAAMGSGMAVGSHPFLDNKQAKEQGQVNPLTGTSWTSKEVEKNYTLYNQLVSNNTDPTTPEYSAAYSSITSALKKVINPGEGKEQSDPNALREAETALNIIEKAHKVKLSNFNTEKEAVKIADEELKPKEEVNNEKPDSSSIQVTDTPVEDSKPPVPPEAVISKEVEQDDMSTADLESIKIGELTLKSKQRLVAEGLATAEDMEIDTPVIQDTSEIKIEEIADEQPIEQTNQEDKTNRAVSEYFVTSEDSGEFPVKILRNSDGSVAVFNDAVGANGVVEYNADFAKDKSDEELMSYIFEPIGYVSSQAHDTKTTSIPQEPIEQIDTAKLPSTPDTVVTGDNVPTSKVEGRTSENERFRQSIAKLEKDVSDLTRANQYKDEAINLYRSKEKIDPKTGIRSYSAYKSDPSKSLQVSIDADSLKWINDNLGHKEGDQLLAYIGQAMAQVAPEDSYHVSGDEFILQAGSIKEATERMKAVEKILETVSFGNDKHTINGIGISYGIAGKLDVADKKLQDHKNKREQEGKRAARGAQPFNISNNAETASSSQVQAAQAEPTSQVIQPIVPAETKATKPKKEKVSKEPVKVHSPGDVVSVNLPATYQYRDTKKPYAIPSKMRGKDITVEIISPVYNKAGRLTDYNAVLRTTTSTGYQDDYPVRLGVKEIGELVGTTEQAVQEPTAPVVQEAKVEPVKEDTVTSQGDAESLSRDYLDAIDAEDRELASEIKARLQEEFGITSPSKYLKDLKAGKVIEEAGDLSLADKTILKESTEFDEEESDENYNQEVDRTIETDEDQFSFAGESSNTANLKSRDIAASRLATGESKESVRRDTGWFKGVDGKWRYEIDDSQASFKIPFSSIEESPLFGDKVIYKLEDVLNHPQLFSAYPSLRSMSFTKQKGFMDFGGLQGFFTPESNLVNITPYSTDPLSTLLHEIQHAIQTIETFAKGGNEDSVINAVSLDRLKSIAEGLHNTFLGKAEALKAEYTISKKIIENPLYKEFLQLKIESARHWIDYKGLEKDFEELAEDSRKKWYAADKQAGKILRSISRGLGFNGIIDLPYVVYKDSDIKADSSVETVLKVKKESIDKMLSDALSAMDKVAVIRTGSKEGLINLIKETSGLFDLYQSLAGEVESRNVQARQNLTEQERLETPISQTQDVKDDQVIITFKNPSEANSQSNAKPATLLIFEDLVNNYLSQSIKDTVDFKYIPNFSTYDWVGEEGVSLSDLHSFQGGGGVVRTSKATGKKTVFINGSNKPSSFVGVFIHEVVGHVGLRKLFNTHYKLNKRQIAYNKTSERPLDAYDNFLVNLLHSDKELLAKIFSKSNSWFFYVDQWAVSKGAFKIDPKTNKKIVDKDKYNELIKNLDPKFVLTLNAKNIKNQIVPMTIPADVAARYADEYMADLAKDLFFKDAFLEKAIGLTEAERATKREANLKGFKKFLMKIRHFLRAVFGKYSLDVKNADLVRMIALSHDSVFAKPIYKDSPVRSFKFDNATVYVPKIEGVGNTTSSGVQSDAFSPGDAVDPDTQLEEKFLNDPFVNPQYIQDIKSFVKMEQLASNEAVGKSVSSRLSKQFNDRIDASAFLSSFKALGNLTAPDLYNMISNVYKGAIGNIEAKSLHIAKIFDKLDPIQNEAAFKFMTTKGADINDVDITDLQKKYLVKAKEDIRKLGQLQVDAGLLSQDVFDKFEDSYLHRIYMDHIKDYRGSGKRTSFMSHLQHRKNKSEAERIALGEIKDIRFLLADTLGTIGRDTVLLQLFDTLKKGSLDGGIHWVLTSNEKVKWFRKKLTIDQAMEQIERNEELIRWYAEDTARKAHYVVNNTPEVDRRYNLTFFATPEQQAELVARNDLLKQAVDEVEHKALEDAFNKASSTKVTTSKDKAEFLENHYVRMPNDKRFGALRSQYVRKEIANDLDAFVSPYDMREKSTLEKILAPGGTLERLNAFWKLSMVGLNPASWVRNAVGNFVLLDLSTRTNKATLMGWLFDEVRGYLIGEPSKYWKYSFDLGLFGTTFSANEMQSYFRQYGNSLEESMAKHKALTQTPLDKSLFFLDNRFLGIMQLGKAFATDAKNRVEGKTSHWFSMLEGSFKAVALRDYVTTWEKENGKLIEDLPETERLFVLSKAANHANNNLFDYSQTNSFVKYARRVPMGSPFLTYSYKAFPVAVKSAVQNPIKFLEYATLPALVTQLAMLMNDWDDKDIDKMKRSLNDYQRTNPFITFIPFKDENGKPQVQDLSYLMPWSQTATAGRKIYENYVEDGGVSPVSTTMKSIAAIPSEFGFMGGPLPSVIAAAQSGENGFTGRSIATKGASADQQMMDYMRFGWDMAVPSWVSSHGWLKKVYTEFTTGRGELDRFGDVRYTPSQIATEALGFNTKTVNVKTGLANRQKGYEYKLKELSTYRSSVLKDKNRNNVEKLSELKDITFREKLLRKQMQEATAQ